MKIAMILRPDSDAVYGGDTAVMQNMGAALQPLGAEVVVAKQTDLGPAAGFDVLHLMGMAPIEHVRAMVTWAQSGDVAIVCSPLYWNDFRDWYERAIVKAPRWRLLARVLGKQSAWRFYRAFQMARAPRDPGWQVNRAGMLASDVIATTSRWENSWLAAHFRLPNHVRQAMRIAPFGIDAARYNQAFTPEQLAAFRARYDLPAGYVVQVARIEEKKNQLAVIEALRDDPTPLVFVGKPSPYYAPDYAERCFAAGARRGNTRFLGWIPDEDLPLMYAAAAAHVMASWVELPGLSSLEAGAMGTRVISTAVSPLPELLADLAWYCDPYDQASIRSAILTALGSPTPVALRPKLLAEYNWQAVAARNLALYEDVVRGHAGRGPIRDAFN